MIPNNIIHGISENTLIRENTKNISEKFWNNNQYIHADNRSWENTIWVSGEYAKHRNKSYNNNCLVPIPSESLATEMEANRFEIMLKQGFQFSPKGVVGLHCIIIDLDTQEVLISQYLTEDDFNITSDKLLIDGSFWMTSANVYLPKTTGLLSAAISELTSEDIDSETGLIYNFVSPDKPLTEKKDMVDTIKTNAEIDENFYLTIGLYSLENKTVEQTLIDYIGHEPADIDVYYTISYGNDSIGYRDLKISNETNKFVPFKIGLDFSNWKNTDDELITIKIGTNIVYENNTLSSENILTTNIGDVINPIINRLLSENKPETIYPVNVTIENKIEQTVVETNIDRQVVQVLQPIFCEIINESIVIENKRIVFEKFNQSGYLVISKTKKNDEQILKNEITVDNRYYFDLSKLTPVDEDTTYILYDENQQMILGRGNVYVKFQDNIVPSIDMP